LLLGVIAGMISGVEYSSFFPLIFSLAIVIGFLKEITQLIDAGVSLGILSFIFLNRNLLPTEEFVDGVINLLLIVAILFSFVSAWFFAKYILAVQNIEENMRGGVREGDKPSYEFPARNLAVFEISSNLLVAAMLTIGGSLIGIYVSTEPFLAWRTETIMMIVFSVSLFFVIYVMMNILQMKED